MLLEVVMAGIWVWNWPEMEVKFRIGEREEKISGGELDAPYQSQYPVPDLFQIRVSDFQSG